ncbi:hypothetical protein ACFE04_023362 [Oxalis oulophora]
MFGGGGENESMIPMMNMMTSPRGQQQNQQQAQWGPQETKEFIRIRGELEKDFKAAKRNKTLWEVVSVKMSERGYVRSPDQCKCKWKNLVNRYKGKETSDPGVSRSCPFFEELHSVFTERANNTHHLLLESENITTTAAAHLNVKRNRSPQEFSEGENDDTEEYKPSMRKVQKKKVEKVKTDEFGGGKDGTVEDMLKKFFQQQQRMEMEWNEMMERRASERELFEEEWRRSMEQIERERLMIERERREREEERRVREESRAERRDELLTTLLTKLINE